MCEGLGKGEEEEGEEGGGRERMWGWSLGVRGSEAVKGRRVGGHGG
jgi:hypothetical protein